MDPYAEDFLKDVLGPEKWEIFSARLFERRLGAKAKGKGRGKPGEDGDNKSSISAIEFLVKVEVVKEILRSYVPHPYNPLKSLTHPYPRSPSGQVTLTRSTILQLCGWSNTQFSYWARRAEAVSVLSEYDSRLRSVGSALERRLRDNVFSDAVDEDEAALVTGKGLDAIVDEVKKRTGKSQFLRGKHSSLDPYGTVVSEDESSLPTVPVTSYATTFQATGYDHWLTRAGYSEARSLSPDSPPGQSPTSWSKKEDIAFAEIQNSSTPNRTAAKGITLPPISSWDPTALHTASTTLSGSGGGNMGRKANEGSTLAPQNFAVPDSRLDIEAFLAKGKRKPGERDKIPPGQKRARTFCSDDEA